MYPKSVKNRRNAPEFSFGHSAVAARRIPERRKNFRDDELFPTFAKESKNTKIAVMRSKHLLPLACALALLTACEKGGNTSKFEGTWELSAISARYDGMSVTLNEPAQVDALIALIGTGDSAESMDGFSGECLFRTTVTITRDGDFHFHAGCDNPYIAVIDGICRADGDTLTLTAKKEQVDDVNLPEDDTSIAGSLYRGFSDQDNDQPLTAVLNDDGTLTLTPGDSSLPVTFTFTKK